jgi:hypothetical protein
VPILRKLNSTIKNSPSRSPDDIPIAQRDRFTLDVTTLTVLRRQRKLLTRGIYVAIGIALASIALAVGTFLFEIKAQRKPAPSQQAEVSKISTHSHERPNAKDFAKYHSFGSIFSHLL